MKPKQTAKVSDSQLKRMELGIRDEETGYGVRFPILQKSEELERIFMRICEVEGRRNPDKQKFSYQQLVVYLKTKFHVAIVHKVV